MADTTKTLSDEQLGAYADGELDELTRTRIEHALSTDRAARARLAAIRDVSMLVRAATRPVAADATSADARSLAVLPQRVEQRRVEQHGRARTWRDWRLAASFIVGLAVMSAVLQIVRIESADIASWQRSALEFHGRYDRALGSGTALALDHSQPSSPAFATDFARLVDFEPMLPDLSAQAYRPAGARLVASNEGPVTFVVYESDDQPRIGYSMTQTGEPAHEEFALTNHQGVSMVSWSDGRFEYGLSGRLSGDALELLAQTAQSSLRDQMLSSGERL